MSDDTEVKQSVMEGENRYGVASLDQMDDDEATSSSSAAASAASSSNNDAPSAAPAVAEVESYGVAVGVIEPPPDLKGQCDNTRTVRTMRFLSTSADDARSMRMLIVVVLCRRCVALLVVIIDRTADFVRRVGPQFEGEIMQRNKYVATRTAASATPPQHTQSKQSTDTHTTVRNDIRPFRTLGFCKGADFSQGMHVDTSQR
jgi:hypothetical protein